MNKNESSLKKVADFWSGKASGYNSKEKRWYLFYEYNLRNKLAFDFAIKHQTNSNSSPFRLVDFGCGNGMNLYKISKFCSHCYGVDVADEMVAIAEKNAPDCQIKKGRLEEFSQKVDVIMAIGLYEYLDNPESLFDVSNKILPKGGLLIFSFNKKGTFFGVIETWYRLKKKKFFPQKEQSLNNQYTKDDVLKLCNKYNFNIVEEHNYGFRSNLFCISYLKYFYPLIEIVLDKILIHQETRSRISTNTLLTIKKR